LTQSKLQSIFKIFFEVSPFFDNDKYILKGEERRNLIQILNSNKSNKDILRFIRGLQKKYIGKENPRTQRLSDLDIEKQNFINSYNSIYRLLDNDSIYIKNDLKEKKISNQFIQSLAINLNVLSADNLKHEPLDVPSQIEDDVWLSLVNLLKSFIEDKDKKRVRRFRRLIPVNRIVKLADMLNEIIEKIKE